jgi:hypothetical protein
MRYVTHLAVTAALVGSALMFSNHSAAAAPNAGAELLGTQATTQADTRFIQAQAPRGQRVGAPNRGGRVAGGANRGGRVAGGGGRRGGGGGGGGVGGAAAAIGIAGAIMSGIMEAEEARAAAEQDSAIALCARRYRSYDPQTQTYIGRGGRVNNCP